VTARVRADAQAVAASPPAPSFQALRHRPLLPKLRIGRSGDAFEREADRIADAALRGTSTRPPSRLGAATAVQRQDEPTRPSDAKTYGEAAKKIGEAFRKTDVGKQIEDRAAQLGEDFLATLPGKIVTGAAAVGAVTAIAATNAELPMQLPKIPLDALTPGLSMELTYEGPVRRPTKAFISFRYVFGAGKTTAKKPAQSASETYRAETDRMEQDLNRFREGLKTPQQRAAEEEVAQRAHRRMGARDPLRIPGLTRRTGVGPPRPEKEEETPLARQEAGSATTADEAPPLVHEVLEAPGRPLDGDTRADMESRLGHDFSRVRIHTDARAAASARAVDALAYTVGADIVFSHGMYRPQRPEGTRLLAHELAHVVQQIAPERTRFTSHGSGLRLARQTPEAGAAGRERAERQQGTGGGRIVRIDAAHPPGWVEVSPTYWLFKFGEPFELPHFLKVQVESVAEGRANVTALEGRYADKDADVDTASLGAGTAGPAATARFDIAKKEFRFGNSRPIAAKTDAGNPVPKGRHDIEIPDFQHHLASGYGDFATTWFRLGHSGDRYLHPGRISAGCATVTETSAWPKIWSYLITRRKDAQSVGELEVV
jgi:hypothetical protein